MAIWVIFNGLSAILENTEYHSPYKRNFKESKMQKKIAIITLVGDNYGNKYQNYAVEQLFQQYGKVTTFPLEELNTVNKDFSSKKISKFHIHYIKEVLTSRMMYKYDVHSTYRGTITNLLFCFCNGKKIKQIQKKRRQAFFHFSNENLHISSMKLNRENTSNNWADGFNCFVCGSDQIWNPTYSETSELAFCAFAPQKTICLSPSFGVSSIPLERKDEYSKWIEPIYALSVREEIGAKIIQELTGRDAKVLLDPTMLIPVDVWCQLCKRPQRLLPPKYIVCYFLGKIDRQSKKLIQQLANKINLPVIYLFDTVHPKYYFLDPAEVLFTINKADWVLTDSFHGTVFSILFKKNFYVFKRNEGGLSMNSRLDTLLSKFNFDDRTYPAFKTVDIGTEQWNNVEKILQIERDIATDYIHNALTNMGFK